MWNLWAWEGTWRVLATYDTRTEAEQSRRRGEHAPGRAVIAIAGGKLDGDLRARPWDQETLRR